jgi:hypothetical protein
MKNKVTVGVIFKYKADEYKVLEIHENLVTVERISTGRTATWDKGGLEIILSDPDYYK